MITGMSHWLPGCLVISVSCFKNTFFSYALKDILLYRPLICLKALISFFEGQYWG
jgi:hypothetical protein